MSQRPQNQTLKHTISLTSRTPNNIAFVIFYVNGYYVYKLLKVALNQLNAELNPICQFLALLGAQPILHVSRIGLIHVGHSCITVLNLLNTRIMGLKLQFFK